MLTLPIKRCWFDLILSGEKREEYRSISPYYNARFKRFEGQKIDVCFRNGYRRNSPAIICSVIPVCNKIGRPEWGAEPGGLYWALQILEIKEALNCESDR